MKSSVSLYSKEHSQSNQRIQEITCKTYKCLQIKYLAEKYIKEGKKMSYSLE